LAIKEQPLATFNKTIIGLNWHYKLQEQVVPMAGLPKLCQ
jgi:hypothetical protein